MSEAGRVPRLWIVIENRVVLVSRAEWIGLQEWMIDRASLNPPFIWARSKAPLFTDLSPTAVSTAYPDNLAAACVYSVVRSNALG